jgi:hypothetical protein
VAETPQVYGGGSGAQVRGGGSVDCSSRILPSHLVVSKRDKTAPVPDGPMATVAGQERRRVYALARVLDPAAQVTFSFSCC